MRAKREIAEYFIMATITLYISLITLYIVVMLTIESALTWKIFAGSMVTFKCVALIWVVRKFIKDKGKKQSES